MLAHRTDPNLYLLSIDDLDGDTMPRSARPYADDLRTVADWARDYLAEPHPELGRTGPVCPYVPTALKRRLFHLTTCPSRPEDESINAVSQAVGAYRDWFGELPPTGSMDAMYKTIVILFPDAPPSVIDAVQSELKSSFVEQGLMLGQFHSRPPVDGGLWNADFRPLRCPVPLLAIRHMVPSDLPFLVGDRRYLDGYRRVFGDDLPQRQKDQLADAMASFDEPSRVG